MNILTSVTSTKVIERLEKIFCTMGYRSRWKHFNGTQFVSDEFEHFLKKNDIEHRTSTPLWPQANREVERQNRSLLKALMISKAEKKNIWTEMRKFLTAYRTTPHSSTGVTPAKLLFNREIRSWRFLSWETRDTPTVRQETRMQRVKQEGGRLCWRKKESSR